MLLGSENPLPFGQSKFDFLVSRQRSPVAGAEAFRRFFFRRAEILEPVFFD